MALYIVKYNRDEVYVASTLGNKILTVSKEELANKIRLGAKVSGVRLCDSGQYKLENSCKIAATLEDAQIGTPLRIKLSRDLPFEEVIYCGMNQDGVFRFFDDSGLSGLFELSRRFITDKCNVSKDMIIEICSEMSEKHIDLFAKLSRMGDKR